VKVNDYGNPLGVHDIDLESISIHVGELKLAGGFGLNDDVSAKNVSRAILLKNFALTGKFDTTPVFQKKDGFGRIEFTDVTVHGAPALAP
jgi:hypothetical protein